MCINLYRKTGLLFLFLLCSFSLLPAQESSDSKLARLENILMLLENESLNSKELLAEQEIELANWKKDYSVSEITIQNLEKIINSLKNNILILDGTIFELKKEIETLKNQTSEVSDSLEKASISFENYVKTTKIVMGIGGTIIIGLAIVVTYKILEDR